MATNDWNPALYNQKHAFVFEYGKDVLAVLDPQPHERILDVGCGTGHLTKLIADAGAKVVGIDSSARMIEAAQAAFPDIPFKVADARTFSFAEPFDAVFSNATLHWVREADQAAACIAKSLRVDGRFVAEFGGKGNLQTIHYAVREAIQEVTGQQVEHGRYYPSIGEYATVLEETGLTVRRAWLFDRPTPLADGDQGLRNWLTMFDAGLLAPFSEHVRHQIIEHVENKVRRILFKDGNWYADYKRLRIVAYKEASQ